MEVPGLAMVGQNGGCRKRARTKRQSQESDKLLFRKHKKDDGESAKDWQQTMHTSYTVRSASRLLK